MADQIRVVLDLDASGFGAGLSRAASNLQGMSASISRANAGVASFGKRIKAVTPSLRDWVVVTSGARFALTELFNVTVGWQVSLLNMNGEIERSQKLLSAMGDAANAIIDPITGMTKEMSYFLDLSAKSPFSLDALTNAAVKFKSAGLDPTAAGFRALTDAVSAFGGSDESLKRASVAIQQMSGKGVISMEELRQQLGEALPSALKLMARSMGLTVKDLTKQVSDGQVAAGGAINSLLAELQRNYEGMALELTKTWFGTLARLETGWQIFVKNIGLAGFDQAGKSVAEGLVNFINSEDALSLARDIGTALTAIINFGKSILEFRSKHAEAFKVATQILGAVLLNKLLAPMVLIGKAMGGLGKTLGVVARVFGNFKVVALSLAATLRGGVVPAGFATRAVFASMSAGALSFSGVMAALAGPIGIIISLLALLGLRSSIAGAQMDAAVNRLKDGAQLTVKELDLVGQKIDELTEKSEKLKEVGPQRFSLKDGANLGGSNGNTEEKNLEDSLKAEKEAAELRIKLDNERTENARRQGQIRFDQAQVRLGELIQAENKAYQNSADLLSKQVEAAGGESKALYDKRIALVKETEENRLNYTGKP